MKNAVPLFIYAATACRFVGDNSWDPVERLSEITQEHSSENDDTKNLAELYTQVLELSLVQNRRIRESTQLCDRFKEVVGTIVVLFDEFSINSMAQLLSRGSLEIDGCLANLHSVLNVLSDHDTPIRLLHPSLRDFLLSGQSHDTNKFHVDEGHAHATLAKRCLEIIAESLTRNLCSLSTPGSGLEEVEESVRDGKLPQHVRYSCIFWVDHLEHAHNSSIGNEQLDILDRLVREYVEKQFLNWLEATSILGKTSQAVQMMKRSAIITKVCPPSYFCFSHPELSIRLASFAWRCEIYD